MRPNSRIHPDDEMFHGSTEHYYSVGSQMCGFIVKAASLAKAEDPTVLELPCGYGRVTRHLARHFSSARVHVADVMKPAVDFCVAEFGVTGYYVERPIYEFRNIEDGRFDAAALASLITHLSNLNARTVMRHFFAKLRLGGVAVVTTHGERSREILGASDCYQIGEGARQHLLASYDEGKYGFVNYRPDHSLETKTVEYIGDSYGIAVIPAVWVQEVCGENGVTILERCPGGWDGHQDVFFIQRE
jgi:SAM-dependent methyltransferase